MKIALWTLCLGIGLTGICEAQSVPPPVHQLRARVIPSAPEALALATVNGPELLLSVQNLTSRSVECVAFVRVVSVEGATHLRRLVFPEIPPHLVADAVSRVTLIPTSGMDASGNPIGRRVPVQLRSATVVSIECQPIATHSRF